jgi:mannose-6-phosphate isomerase-like protein (cupin superfamily)
VILAKINLAEKFGRFTEQWSPKIVGELNGQHVKLARVQGEFVWHTHDAEDELFYVVRGSMVLRFRDGDVELAEGEMCIVPRGVEHMPMAEDECWIMMFEPASTVNTGDAGGERTVASPDWI